MEIPDALAEKRAMHLVLEHSATLQHQTLTEQGLTPAESGPITELVFENLDDELEHLRRITERIRKQRKYKELRCLIAGKTTHAHGKLLDALAEPLLLKQVDAEFAMLPI